MNPMISFEPFFQHSQDLLAVVGADDSIVTSNAAWLGALGWTPEELVSKPFHELVYSQDEKLLKVAFEDSRAELRLLSKSGGYRWFTLSSTSDPARTRRYLIAR